MEVVRLFYGSLDPSLVGPVIPFNGYAIKHPKGVVLVDTGFGPTFGEGVSGTMEMPGDHPGFHWVRRSTIDALADHDLHPSDVKYIINTHLGDHSGDNVLFQHAEFIIQAPEAVYARKRHAHVVGQWDFAGANLHQLQSEDAEILTGVKVLFTPGHTPGHQSILLEDEGTKTLFVGDAAYTNEIWDEPSILTEEHAAYGAQFDLDVGREKWVDSVNKLKAVGADVTHFAHDAHIRHR